MLGDRPILHPRSVAACLPAPLRREVIRAETYAEALSIGAPGEEHHLDVRVRTTYARLVAPGKYPILYRLERRDVRAALWCCYEMFEYAAKTRYGWHSRVREAVYRFCTGDRARAYKILAENDLLMPDIALELTPTVVTWRGELLHDRLRRVLVMELLSTEMPYAEYPLALSYAWTSLLGGWKSPSKRTPAGTVPAPDKYRLLHDAILTLPDITQPKPRLPRPSADYEVDGRTLEWKTTA